LNFRALKLKITKPIKVAKKPRKFKDYNNGWTKLGIKITGLKLEREKLYTKISNIKVFSEYMKLRKEVDRLNRHIEVLETFNDDRKSEERQRQMIKEYAVYTR